MTSCRCGNEARYWTAGGAKTCALCAMLAAVPAVRESDMAEFIRAVADLVEEVEGMVGDVISYTHIDKIKTLLGRYK